MVGSYRTQMSRCLIGLFMVDPPSGQLETTGLQTLDADPPIDETAPETAVWHSGIIPSDWKKGLVVPIWKGKGDHQE